MFSFLFRWHEKKKLHFKFMSKIFFAHRNNSIPISATLNYSFCYSLWKYHLDSSIEYSMYSRLYVSWKWKWNLTSQCSRGVETKVISSFIHRKMKHSWDFTMVSCCTRSYFRPPFVSIRLFLLFVSNIIRAFKIDQYQLMLCKVYWEFHLWKSQKRNARH